MRGKYLFLLIFLTLLVYANSFGNGFVWDDYNTVVDNESLEKKISLSHVFLKPTSKPPARYYRPLSYLTIWLDYQIWNKNPFGYHLTNVLFHLFCV